MYDTQEDANQRLSGCVVLFKGEPVFIQSAAGKGTKLKLKFTRLRGNKEDTESIHDKGWDFKNLGARLGYSNVDLAPYKESIYIQRLPVRNSHSTQGLSAKNLRWSTLKGSPRLGINATAIQWQSLYNAPYFCDTLEEKYPAFSKVVSDFKDKTLVSRAFDRKFAVNRPDVGPFYMEYRGKNIGYSDDLYRWKISDDFSYLRESLENINVRV